MKSRITAALLAFFLGGFGVHKFYLEKHLFGALYLIFCWTFIPAIIAFVEFILFLTMSDEEFNKKYNEGVEEVKRPITQNGMHYTEELEKLHALKVKGIISDEEFSERKRKIVN